MIALVARWRVLLHQQTPDARVLIVIGDDASTRAELRGGTDADLELLCRDLPSSSFGYFLVGPNAGSMPVGQGVLCIGAPQFRYSLFVQDSGAGGSVRFEIDLSALPNGAPVLAGDRYIFQYWHRDNGSTSNLSPWAPTPLLRTPSPSDVICSYNLA